MQRRNVGEYNLGAISGAVVGSIGGLFAVSLARAIINGNAALLFDLPILGMLSWIISGVSGWFLGGWTGPRVGQQFRSQRAEMLGGGLAGLVPVVLIALWGWWMVTRPT